MSRRKQQNPKPVKYDEDKSKMTSRAKEIEREIHEQGTPEDDSKSDDGESSSPIPSANPAAHYSTQGADPDVSIKDEPPSPVERQNVSPTPPASEMSLEAKLGVPDDAPLKVQRRADDDGYTILSAKPISKGAGLDPLRAQRIEPPDDRALIKNNPQIVSFESISKGRIFFLLESAINCGWLKYIGSPGDDFEANLRIYYVGGQLWVEVIKNLTEGEELIAEFCDPSKDGKMHQQDNGSETVTRPASPPKSSRTQATNQSDSPYPCTLCGISFRNPNTLAAHKKHYCSKLNSPTTSNNVNSESRSPGSSAANADDIKDPTSDNLQQTAFICTVCKFMSLTQADMKTHVRDKHKTKQDAMEAASRINRLSSDKTYCDDCEIHFKKPESYQAHKQYYCKNRTNTNSPRSDNGAASSQQSLSQSTPPLSPSSKEMYKKVSVFDNQTLTASLATQAAAAMAAASLPFTLSSMLNLPGAVAAATLPMMPHLKMFQSPALLAQAMQNAVKTGGAATSSTHKDETAPLDLTVKQEMLAASAGTLKRKSEDADSDMSPPMKRSASVHSNSTPGPISPASESGMPVLPRHPASVKPSPKRTIYRCESCSIPFYKREVYEAHKQHYCAHRSNNTSDKEDDMIPSPTKAKSENIVHHPPVVDERLVITYTCKQCSTSYRTIETFTAHTCTLPAASPPILQCDECSFTTQSSRILSEHADTHLKVNLVFKCKICGYHGNTMRGMRQHGRQHMMSGEEFCDDDVESMELPITVQRVSAPALPMKIPTTVDEELLRLKNEPYKKRRSRKHYQKSEYSMTPTASIPPMPQISPQRKENGMSALQIVRPDSASPHSSSTVSCGSPLQQISTSNIPQDNGSEKSNTSPPPSMVKQEPTEIIVDSTTSSTSPQSPSVALPAPHKPHVCSCNASFASISTFEAHKKLYCPHFKAQQRSHTTITVNN